MLLRAKAKAMNKTKASLLVTLWAIFVKGKKHYICPAANTLISLLDQFHGADIKRRWLFYCLADLREQKFIRMKRRYIRDETNLVKQIPSMIALTAKGVQYMSRRFVGGAQELYSRMLSFMKKDQARFPRPSDIFPEEERMEPAKALARLRILIKDLG